MNNWLLHYRGDQFAETLLVGSTLFVRRGAVNTWGESEVREQASETDLRRVAADLEQEGYEPARAWNFAPDRFDHELLLRELVLATRTVWPEIVRAHPATNAFALLSDGSAMTIGPVSNAFDDIDAAADDVLWNPAEWAQWAGGEHFDVAYRLILSMHRDDLSTVDWATWRRAFDDTVVCALEQLASEGLFGLDPEKRVLMYACTDSASSPAVARLNSPRLSARLMRWLLTWDGPPTA